MLSIIASAALLSLASAAPAAWGPPNDSWGKHHYGGSSTSSAPASGQTPFKFPLDNGFPNIQVPSAALTAIEKVARGTLPNGALPTHLNATTIGDFSVIATNELFEVAFFSSLINNITNNVSGYEIGTPSVRDFVLRSLTAVQAQEELHAIGANGILASAGATPIKPCEYIFPVDNFDDAITLAFTFTDVVLGTLQKVQADLAADGDAELIPLVASIIGQEGEQNGYYRTLEGHVPSSLPFLTRSAGPFAFSALNQAFIVPGSCPQTLPVPIFGVLNVDTKKIQAEDQTLQFSFENTNGTYTEDLSIVYINQQNTPVVEKISNLKTYGKKVTFDAFFPFNANLMNGLTIAAVTTSAGPFASADEVAKATIFGPGLIEIN